MNMKTRHFISILKNRRRPMVVESLESRLPLAGNVSAVLTAPGDLMIKGDAADNRIAVIQRDEQIVVSGLDGDTLVNGQPQMSFDVADVTRSLRIQLFEGNDSIRLGGESHETDSPTAVDAEAHDDEGHDEHDDEESRLTIRGDVVLLLDGGDDSVRISFVDIHGDLTIKTMGDDDTAADMDLVNIGRGPGFEEEDGEEHPEASPLVPSVSDDEHDDHASEGPMRDVTVHGRTHIHTGDGDDSVRVAFASLNDDLRIKTGEGGDLVVTGRGPINGRHGQGGGQGGGHEQGGHEVSLASESTEDQTGKPADVRAAASVIVDTGAGNDYTILRNMDVNRSLTVNTKAGTDALGTQNVTVGQKTWLRTGPDDDTLLLLASTFEGPLTIATGSSRDTVALDRIDAKSVSQIDVSSHDDTLVIANSLFADESLFKGGSGTDRLAVIDTLFLTPPELEDWETVDTTIAADVLRANHELFQPFLQGT